MENPTNEIISPYTDPCFIDRFWSKVDKIGGTDSCWLWMGHTVKSGHGQVKVGGKVMSTHRVAYMMEHGAIQASDVIRHDCDEPSCVNPAHLSVGTHADNVADRVARGRSAVGENNGRAKLDTGKVKAIRAALSEGGRITYVAKEFGVCRKTISGIRTGKNWAG